MSGAEFIVRHDGARGTAELTEKEKMIVRLICDDYSTKEISGITGRSVKTIDHHRANIYKKTGKNSLVGLFRWAILNGLLTVTNDECSSENSQAGPRGGGRALPAMGAFPAAETQTAKTAKTAKTPEAEKAQAITTAQGKNPPTVPRTRSQGKAY